LLKEKKPLCCLQLAQVCEHCSYRNARDYQWQNKTIILAADYASNGIYNLYYTVEGAFPVQDLAQSDHFAAGKETGHCIPGCNLLLSAGLLDVGHDRLVTPPNSTTRTILTRARFQSGRPPQGRNHSRGERGRRQQRTLQFRRGGLARRLQHDRGGPGQCSSEYTSLLYSVEWAGLESPTITRVTWSPPTNQTRHVIVRLFQT
jgi:hypothetical protein